MMGTKSKSFIGEKQKALIRVWDHMMRGVRNYIEKERFTTLVGVPLIGSATIACENVNTLFSLDFYGCQAFLSQSDQLLIEPYSQEFERVYCEIQSFRRELTADNRRLAQFTLAELEVLTDLDGLLKIIEGAVKSAANELIYNCPDEVEMFGRDPNDLVNLSFARVPYTEAVETLQGEGFKKLNWGDDLGAKEEKYLANLFGPHFLTHFPEEIKFWNMRNNDYNSLVVDSSDLILPLAGESCGSARRETDPDKLEYKLEKSSMLKTLLNQGMKRESFNWYIQYHRDYDIKMHSGCGLGMNRICQFLLNQEDIREVSPFLVNAETLP